jgi:phospholipid transport system substrate-binding protein
MDYMKKFSILSSITAFALLFTIAGIANAKDTEAVKAYLDKTSSEIIGVIQSDKSDSVKATELEKQFKAHVDTKWMANFVIGRYIHDATPAQKDKYFTSYQKYLINSYVPKFKQYTGQSFKISSVSESGKDEYVAKTTIASNRSSTGDIYVDYRIIKSGNSYKIVDIIGEGVSLITTQRSDFAGLITRRGFDFFLTKLEERVASQEAKGGKNAAPEEEPKADKKK